ncbi:MAG: nicotinate-nucleotide adenylyltransferase [Deltaproteobacteria bacterium]|nr:nicotinate-nucleotide adenylyltransferase [Deltaproteobacteria bacterium]
MGILGGTFDPVHLGHLRAAEEAAEALGLDEVAFVPARKPPHKPGEPTASPEDRLEMARLAVVGRPGFFASDMELFREGPSYSLDTLRVLGKERPGTDLYFLLGTDAFVEIHTWHRWEELFSHAHFVVLTRPPRAAEDVAPYVEQTLAGLFSAEGGEWRHKASGNRLIPLSVTALDISATAIRGLLARGKSIRWLVPEPVRDYIILRKLYTDAP